MNHDLVSYYHRRAQEYERVYQKPERQTDIAILHSILSQSFEGKHVLEIGAGTGYWTPDIASSAQSVLATDINESTLEIAQQKPYPNPNVQFQPIDMKVLPGEYAGKFSALFGGFVWSHIKWENVIELLQKLHRCLQPKSQVIWMDNQYVAGSNHPITHTDKTGNTFQTRKLQDGSAHLVLKNFPSDDQLRSVLDGLATNISIQRLEYYWILSYQVLPMPE